ncbi:bromodomain-containing protein 8-like isoform X2 [Actinia tenebrosa]|uniref:Bromodomain-containing protein 8-like isoform X2 n=1 Tax=Actinia tenebrosa TaxID=6105 RepID=A0A6P8IZK9_ACTTE|nr:bromodomain-containing protein 8-like isoform X2 [Actinia tenebrosa]
MAFSFQAPKHKSAVSQPQDEWTVREKLCLASSVLRSGDQNWVSVSRAIKPINETGRCGKIRPPDFFSQKNCAILYSQMLEKVNTPKRKRTSETGAGETPGEQIVRKLTFERIEELKKSVKNDQLTYRKLKMHIEDIRNGKIDQQLPAIWEEIQARKRKMEEMQQMQSSTSGSSAGGDNSPSPFPLGGSSGVLFPVSPSLLFGLKQGSHVATPSPQKGKQLRIPKPTPRFQKYQQQLQQRHGQAGQHTPSSGSPGEIGGTGDPTKGPGDLPRMGFDSEPLKSEPMDIDPGAAVQTVSVEMPPAPQETVTPKVGPGITSPPVQVQHRRSSSGSISGNADSLKLLLAQPPKESTNESLPKKTESLPKTGTDTVHPTLPTTQPKDIDYSMSTAPTVQATPNKQLTDGKSFLGQKSPMENHKVESIRDRVTPAAPSITAPTLSKLLSSTQSPSPNTTALLNNLSVSNSFIEKPLSSKALDSNITISSDISGSGRGMISVGGKDEDSGVAVTTISVNPKVAISDTIPSPIAMTPPPMTPPAEKKEIIPEPLVKIVEPAPPQTDKKDIEDITTKEETEDISVTGGGADHTLQPEIKIEIVDTPQPSPRVTGRTRAPKPGRPGRPRGRRSQRRSKSVTSTDNETEMEEEKEEDTKSETIEVESEKASEKDEEDEDMESTISEKKDDSEEEEEQESIDDGYSESGDRSKEESYLDRSSTVGSESVPASPASQTSQGDMDTESIQAQKTWKKSIMLVWRAAANHKYANVFLHAVTDDEAPGYHNIVFRPMDLTTIKKNIENGTIRTTSEFQRDMMLMFQNALMYNSSDHDVYRMAEEMRDDVMDQIQSYIATQLMVQSSDRDSTKMLRGHRTDVFHFFL